MTSRAKTTNSLATALAEGRAFDPSIARSSGKSKAAQKKSPSSPPAASIKSDSTQNTTASTASTSSPTVQSAASSVYSDRSEAPTMSRKFKRIFSSSSSSSSSSTQHRRATSAAPTADSVQSECPHSRTALKPRTLPSGAVVMEIVVPSTPASGSNTPTSDSASTPIASSTHASSHSFSKAAPSDEIRHDIRPQTTESQAPTASSSSYKSAATSVPATPNSPPSPTTALPPIPSRSSRRMSNPRIVRYPAHLLSSPPGPAPSKPLPSLPAGIRASKRASQLQAQLALEGMTLPGDEDDQAKDAPGESPSGSATPSSDHSGKSALSPVSTDRTSQDTALTAASSALSARAENPKQHQHHAVESASPSPSAFPSVPISPRYSVFPKQYHSRNAVSTYPPQVPDRDDPAFAGVSTVDDIEELFSGPSAELAKAIVRSKSQRDAAVGRRSDGGMLIQRGRHEHLYVRTPLKARPSSFQGREGDGHDSKTRRSLEEENKALKSKVATLEARLMAVELRAKYLAAFFGDGGMDSGDGTPIAELQDLMA